MNHGTLDLGVAAVGEKLLPFAVSLLIALAVGIDRERRALEGENPMGVRTFAVIGLLGSLAGKLDSSALTFGMILLLTVVTALGYHHSAELALPRDIGLTSEVTVGVVFALGYLAISDRLLAAIMGVILATILYSKDFLHTFSRDTLRPSEITSALILTVFAFVFFPLFPNRFVDPWNLFNPRQLGQIILIIACVEFGGYIIGRLLGLKMGALATGFLGGLVSSTAVFLNMAKLSKEGKVSVYQALATCAAATVATLILFVGIVNVMIPTLFVPVGASALAAALIMSAFGVFSTKNIPKKTLSEPHEQWTLDFRGVFKLSLFVIFLLAFTSAVKSYLGPIAVQASSFLSGLFELHGTAIAAATMAASGKLEPTEAIRSLLLAVSASLLSKLILSWVMGAWRFALLITMAILASVLTGSLLLVFLGG
ncbi:MAG: DUF4010 domain-containing protein [Pseudomonadota bacterium]